MEDDESSRSSRTLALWVIELSEFDIQYRPRTAIKGQALANFVVEFMTNIDGDSGALLWKVHTDESLNRRASGIGVVTESPKGDLIKCDLPLIPNNQQWGWIQSSTGRPRLGQCSRCLFSSCLLRFPSRCRTSKQRLWGQRGADEEVPSPDQGTSGWKLWSKIHVSPKGREWTHRPSSQGGVNWTHGRWQ